MAEAVKIKVVIISTLFSNCVEPERGLYTFEITRQMKRLCDTKVIAPVPWSFDIGFWIFKRWQRLSRVPRFEKNEDIEVYHPRYFMIPKIWGPFLALSIFLAIIGLLIRMKRKNEVDAINVHWVYPDGTASALAAKLLKIPIVQSALGSDINLYTRFLVRRLQIEWALSVSTLITTVTEALKEKIMALGFSEEKIKAVPNGIDRERFFLRPKDEARKALRFEGDYKIVLFVGSFDRFLGTQHTIKGAEHLIDAVSILDKDITQSLKVILIGEGPMKKKLEEKVKVLGLSQIISFPGSRPYEEIALWMNACDVFVRPTLIDGMPNVVLEALACGRPVVASRVGGLPDMVNSKNGILAEPGDPYSIAAGLKEALTKKWDGNEIVSTIEKFTWEKTAEGYLEQINRAVLKYHKK